MPCSRCWLCGRWRVTLKEAPVRAWRTIFVMIVLLVSWLASTFPLLVAIADVGLPCILLRIANPCPPCLPLSPSEGWGNYSIRSSLADILIVAVVRSLAAICAYFICGMPSFCHGPYLVTSVGFGAASLLFVAIKAAMFDYSGTSGDIVVSAGEGTPSSSYEPSKWLAPAMLTYSMMFAVLHILVAYREVFSARRKLRLQRLDDDISGQISSDYWKLPLTPGSAKGRKPSFDGEGKPSSDENDDEKDLPPQMLADPDSEFMECEGISVHFKKIGVGSPHSALSPSRRGGSIGSCSSAVTFVSSSSSVALADCLNACVSGPKLTHSLSGGRQSAPSSRLNLRQVDSCSDTGDSLSQPLLKSLSGSGTVLYTGVHVEEWDRVPFPVGNGDVEGRRKWSDDVGVVLLHGFGGGVFSWRNVMPLLSLQLGCTVVACDRPGFGLTSRPMRAEWERAGRPNPYRLESQVNLLMSFCRSLGLRSVVLVGHADGGLLALMAAAAAIEAPDSAREEMVEVKGLVLLDTSLVQGVMPTFARVLLQTSLGRRMLRPLLRSEIGEVANRRAWYDARKLTPEVLKHYKVPLRVEGWDSALGEVGRLPAYGDKASTAAMLRSISSLPVMIVAGANDQIVSSKQASVLATEFPLSRLLIIDECGHLPHEECPGALLSAMVPFVRKVLESSGKSQVGCGAV
ncbi:hypothetical protein CBR_g40151 [Chara braunii]|uniref:AB hydrolase-1 domain-containing protein n=1 Tax=Chara braunii TaxID=69332 RepID=A0A388LTH1_CHABU|nr:hypothetical protein CBR_g40151 [Chara braunii]|eukprot:GBG85512.1 hypothetical protein CBR_g40151 [Chara braunii]